MYEVIVGNIGRVYDGSSATEAKKTFSEYRSMSISEVGRAGGQCVSLLMNGESLFEFDPDM